MCKDFQPVPEQPMWEDRLRAERTALVESYFTKERHWPTEFADNLPQGPLTEAEQDALSDFSANLGRVSMCLHKTTESAVILEFPVNVSQNATNMAAQDIAPPQLA